tara:strand:- start:16378 stop:17202 length:825 start_codon:yes stop_codon:yes gene_type:complete
MKKIITIAGWRRPQYFKEVIDSLMIADGIDEYKLLVSLDGGYHREQKKMVKILRNSNLDYDVTIHNKNLGCAENTRYILNKGFNQFDKVIHLEDDTVIHPQALTWFEHNLDYYEHNLKIFSISGYTNGKMNESSLDGNWTEPHVVGIRSWFSCWGWATWKRVWDEIKDSWFGIEWKDGIGVTHEGRQSRGEDFLQYITKNNKGSWGIPMNHYWRNERYEISPHTSFIQNIGVENSTWATEEVHKYKQFTDWFKPNIIINSEWEHYFVEDFMEGL